MSTKNVNLSTISGQAVNKLSVFAMNASRIVKLQNEHKAITQKVKYYKTKIENGHCKGVVNLPVNPYDMKQGTETVKGKNLIDRITAINAYAEKIENQYKARIADEKALYNEAIKATIPDGLYQAYCEGLNGGSYDMKDKAEKSLMEYLAKMLRAMNVSGTEDDKAVRKFAASIAIFAGGRYTMKNGAEAMGQAAFEKLIMGALVKRFTEKNILTKTPKGLVKLSKEEAEARKQRQEAAAAEAQKAKKTA